MVALDVPDEELIKSYYQEEKKVEEQMIKIKILFPTESKSIRIKLLSWLITIDSKIN